MNDTENNKQSSGDVINFDKKKGAHLHQRKEKKLKDMQEAFKKALPLKKLKTKKKKNKKKK